MKLSHLSKTVKGEGGYLRANVAPRASSHLTIHGVTLSKQHFIHLLGGETRNHHPVGDHTAWGMLFCRKQSEWRNGGGKWEEFTLAEGKRP